MVCYPGAGQEVMFHDGTVQRGHLCVQGSNFGNSAIGLG
jgi:hypothetical protein